MDSNEFSRPDPDSLLGHIKADEEKSRKGQLKIFFGMVAGVGKTYAMLEAASHLQKDGVDVVIGYIETHKRAETEVLLEGFDILPRAQFEYKGVILEDLDLDAVIARKPSYVLIDELAHTNASGMRHTKRYQDVIEILDHGINVLTTLNVQHLESQIDVVEKITGVKIRETLPDSVLDIADEIELVDIPPEELLKRLAEGKVYTSERAELAAHNFFKKGNIMALREIALRHVAKIVDHDLNDYTKEKQITGPWKSGERLLVAISPSPYSEYLIRWTRRMAFNLKVPWIALYIEGKRKLSESVQKILSKNLNLASELGAEVISTVDDDIVSGLIRVAKDRNITHIVVGKPLMRYFTDFLKGGNIVERLLGNSGDIEIYVVSQPKLEKKKIRIFSPFIFSSHKNEYLKSIIAIVVATVLCLLIAPLTGYWTIALLYLLLILSLSLFLGRGPVFLAAALSSLCWNFLFIPPLYTFRIANIEDALMFASYFIIAIITGNFTSKLRSKESDLRIREKRISSHYEFSRSIANALNKDEIIETAIRFIDSTINLKTAVTLADDSGSLGTAPHSSSLIDLAQNEYGVASWAFANRHPAGRFTDTLPDSELLHLPLASPNGIFGIISVRSLDGLYTFEQENFLQNICFQLTSALEREKMFDIIRKSQINAESERLHSILLNSISHELRTPLTTISGAASGLLDKTISSSPETSRALSSEIKTASDRLNRLVDNLLDMSRIESGNLKLTKQMYDVGDLISVAVRRLEDELSSHKVIIKVYDDLPMMFVDFALMEQALVNIIHNAAIYTPAGSIIRISSFLENTFLIIVVSDNGSGIPESDVPNLFNKFQRGVASKVGGTGLGLSISKGIVETHKGSISFYRSPEGGASFKIAIPVEKIMVSAGDKAL